MSAEKMETSFHLTVEAIQLLQNALETSFFDAYVETIENFVDQYQVRVIDGVPDEATAARLETNGTIGRRKTQACAVGFVERQPNGAPTGQSPTDTR